MRDNAKTGQDQNVHFGMTEEPEQMLEQDRITTKFRGEEGRIKVTVCQQHGDRTGQNRQRQQQLTLVAPVTGTIQELALHTIGGVVSPAQTLMKVVPEEVTIEVEALLANKDIGFVTEGQLAEVKIDTFNFTKYGLIDARIVDISNDVIEDQQLGWVFKMRLSLEQDSIVVAGKEGRLNPGMTATAPP